MTEYKITFNEDSGKYELGGMSLSCGSCLEIWDGEEWFTGRVEYNDNWDRGYYFITFKDGKEFGSIPLWNKHKGRR